MTIGMGHQPLNGPSKGKVKHKEAHVMPTKYGMGDYYGTGIKAKVGTVRDDMMGTTATTPKKLKTPPRSVA